MNVPVPLDSRKKRILFLSTNSPYPIIDGHSQRTFNLLRGAAEEFDVHLLTFVQSPAEEEGVKVLSSFCREVVPIPVLATASRARFLATVARSLASSLPFVVLKYHSARMEQSMHEQFQKYSFNLLHLDMLPLASYCDVAPNIPCVLVDHNVESILLQRRVSHERGLRKLFLSLESAKLRRYETWALGRMDRVVAVSKKDQEDILSLSPKAKVTVVNNGVDTTYFAPANHPEKASTLVFVGSLRWFPNLDAVQYFSREILPHILREIPNIVLEVVGLLPANPPVVHDAIRLLGFVEDTRPIISRGALFIVPLRVGGGTRLKILNALAMEKAVLSTSIGAEGLNLTPERDVVLADTPEQFAHEVVRLLRSALLRKHLGQQGRATVSAHYEWAKLSKMMNGIYHSLISRDQPNVGKEAQPLDCQSVAL